MGSSPFDSAVAGKCVLVTETGMEPLQLLGRVGSTSFVIAGSRRPFCSRKSQPLRTDGRCARLLYRHAAASSRRSNGACVDTHSSERVASLRLSRRHDAVRANGLPGGAHLRRGETALVGGSSRGSGRLGFAGRSRDTHHLERRQSPRRSPGELRLFKRHRPSGPRWMWRLLSRRLTAEPAEAGYPLQAALRPECPMFQAALRACIKAMSA